VDDKDDKDDEYVWCACDVRVSWRVFEEDRRTRYEMTGLSLLRDATAEMRSFLGQGGCREVKIGKVGENVWLKISVQGRLFEWLLPSSTRAKRAHHVE
jgi:hypothetical protein